MAEKETLVVVEVQGVRGYIDDEGTAWLNAADVARGLGFVEAKKFSTSGENYIRWERVNGYLKEFGFVPTSGHDVKAGDYIPENMFYRLAMKASNATAQKFQALVADEILPTLRKQGYYSVNNDRFELDRERAELAREREELSKERVELSFRRIQTLHDEQRIERLELERDRAKLKAQQLELELKHEQFLRTEQSKNVKIAIARAFKDRSDATEDATLKQVFAYCSAYALINLIEDF